MEPKKSAWAEASDEEGSEHETPAAPKAQPVQREHRPRVDLNAYIQDKTPPLYFKLINIPFSCEKAADIQAFLGITDQEIDEKKASVKMIFVEGKFRGIAYVNAWDIEIARKIIAKNESELNGRKVGVLAEEKGPQESKGNRGKGRGKPREDRPKREDKPEGEKEWRREGGAPRARRANQGPRGRGQQQGRRNQERKEEAKTENWDHEGEKAETAQKPSQDADAWGEAAQPVEEKKEVKVRVVKAKAWGDASEAASILAKPSLVPPQEDKPKKPFRLGQENRGGRGRGRGRRPNKE